MKKNNSALFSVFATGVMLLLLYSMHAYFLWWVYDGMAYIFIIECVVAFIGLSYINKNRIPVRFNSKVLIPFFCVWFVEALNPNGIAWVLSRCPFTLLIILLLDRLTLQKLLKIWTNLYAIILSVSLIAWLLAMQGLLPSYGTISFGNDISYVYQNHILCLVNMNLHNFDVIRFCSIFLEPGHVSMIGAFTLYANRYNFKEWTTWPILIASLASLALAGYILIIIGYLMIRLQKSTLMQELWSIVMSAVLLISAYYITISYNNGNNFVNEMIIQRTEFDSEKGIVGNNRTSMEIGRASCRERV